MARPPGWRAPGRRSDRPGRRASSRPCARASRASPSPGAASAARAPNCSNASGTRGCSSKTSSAAPPSAPLLRAPRSAPPCRTIEPRATFTSTPSGPSAASTRASTRCRVAAPPEQQTTSTSTMRASSTRSARRAGRPAAWVAAHARKPACGTPRRGPRSAEPIAPRPTMPELAAGERTRQRKRTFEPVATQQEGIAVAHAAQPVHDHRHREVGDVVGIHARRVGHAHAALVRAGEIQRVQADPQAGDESRAAESIRSARVRRRGCRW